MMMPIGKNKICIFRGIDTDKTNNIRILRDSQAMPGDDNCFIQINSISFDGEFLELPKSKYKLEFIGDSITSGEGLIGATSDRQWLPMFHSIIGHYSLLTANAINADYSILSQGGYGVIAGWDNNPNSVMPKYYEFVCGVLHGERNKAFGALDKYDFTSWQPDAVIINLGTNDNGAFHHEAWVDPESGNTYELRMNSDEIYNNDDIEKFKSAIVDFLTVIRKNNPHAYIVWAYGMLGTPLWDFIVSAVNKYAGDSGDTRLKALKLPCTNENSKGANGHPGRINHKEAADKLTLLLSELLK